MYHKDSIPFHLVYCVMTASLQDSNNVQNQTHIICHLTTIDNFPTAGLEVFFGYPEGTGPNGWVFGVSHMFTQTVPRLGTRAGAVETPPVTKTPDGLRVKLKGLSPLMISWQKEEVAADPNSLPQTGDKSNVLIYALIGVLAVTGIVFLAKRKKYGYSREMGG